MIFYYAILIYNFLECVDEINLNHNNGKQNKIQKATSQLS